MARFIGDSSVIASVSESNPGILGRCPCPWIATSPKPVERRASFDALLLLTMTIPAQLRATIAGFSGVGEWRNWRASDPPNVMAVLVTAIHAAPTPRMTGTSPVMTSAEHVAPNLSTPALDRRGWSAVRRARGLRSGGRRRRRWLRA